MILTEAGLLTIVGMVGSGFTALLIYFLKSRCSTIKVYKYINSNGGINNFKMEVLYESYCNLEEATRLERYYTELLSATLNSEVPGRTQKERDAWYKPIYYQQKRLRELQNKKTKNRNL